MKISLTPRTTEFFTLFTKDGENALEVARLVERRFREHPKSAVTQEQVKAGETAGDAITRDLIVLLNTQYLRPFDREDIYLLATEIDDVVDYLEEASRLAFCRPRRCLRPHDADRVGGQLVSGAFVALTHGTNDAQKTMGIIALALVSSGTSAPTSRGRPHG